MKKKIFISLGVAICTIMTCFTSAHAIDIDGWWTVRTNLLQGDFSTGEWVSLIGTGKKVSYMYICGARENAYSGPVELFLWDDEGAAYIEETYSYNYIKNGVIVFFNPTGQDENGDLVGNTIVLRPFGAIARPNIMKGFYTLYDMESTVTTDLFVRMGTLDMNRIQPKNVPSAVKALQG